MAMPNNTNPANQKLELLRSSLKGAARSYLSEFPNPTPWWQLFCAHTNQPIARNVIRLANDKSYTTYDALLSKILHIVDYLESCGINRGCFGNSGSVLQDRLMEAANIEYDELPCVQAYREAQRIEVPYE